MDIWGHVGTFRYASGFTRFGGFRVSKLGSLGLVAEGFRLGWFRMSLGKGFRV